LYEPQTGARVQSELVPFRNGLKVKRSWLNEIFE
jgi:hypothetical protein